MGLKNRDGGKVTYVKIKEGKFFASSDKELANPFEQLSGVVVDTYLKDEDYNGIPNRKFYTVLEDEGERFIMGLNVESSFASTFISFLMNADLSKSINIFPKVENVIKNGKESQKRNMLISQGGKFLKAYFTKDTPNGLPAMQKVERRGGKIEWIKDELLDFYEDLIINKFKVEANKNKSGEVHAVVTEVPTKAVSTEKSTVTSTLPWEGGSADDADDDLPF